jgi:hypothetical protein
MKPITAGTPGYNQVLHFETTNCKKAASKLLRQPLLFLSLMETKSHLGNSKLNLLVLRKPHILPNLNQLRPTYTG